MSIKSFGQIKWETIAIVFLGGALFYFFNMLFFCEYHQNNNYMSKKALALRNVIGEPPLIDIDRNIEGCVEFERLGQLGQLATVNFSRTTEKWAFSLQILSI